MCLGRSAKRVPTSPRPSAPGLCTVSNYGVVKGAGIEPLQGLTWGEGRPPTHLHEQREAHCVHIFPVHLNTRPRAGRTPCWISDLGLFHPAQGFIGWQRDSLLLVLRADARAILASSYRRPIASSILRPLMA